MAKPLVDELDRHIGTRLKKLRQQQGVSAQILAEAIDSTQQQVSRYENGYNKLSATQLYRISKALGVPISWFFADFECKRNIRSLAEPNAVYDKSRVVEELAVMAEMWPRMTQDQRATVMRVVDTFVL